MEHYLRVFNHGNTRTERRFSINMTASDGRYICQEAFWYPNSNAAKEAAQRLIAEDAQRGQKTVLLSAVGELKDLP